MSIVCPPAHRERRQLPKAASLYKLKIVHCSIADAVGAEPSLQGTGLYEELDVAAGHASPPALVNSITEFPRTLFEIGSLFATMPLLAGQPRGDGHPVLVLPGFMASDESTRLLRRYLSHLGYTPLPWGLGRNTGRPELLQFHLPERLASLADQYGRKVSLIGQSLGGVFARELARFHAARVRQVITLGSPFGAQQGGSALALVRRMFERQSGMSIDAMRSWLRDTESTASPPVPLTAIFSKGDGIVNWRVCREPVEDHQTQNIEVIGSHCGMAFNPSIYYVLADRLSQPEEGWQKYSARLPGITIRGNADA